MNNVANIESVAEFGYESRFIEAQGYQVLVLSGVIDAHSACRLHQTMLSVLDGSEQHLIVDMHKVSHMTRSGLSVMLLAWKRLSRNCGTLHLVGCTTSIKYVLLTIRLDAIFAMHQTVDDAVEAITSLVAAGGDPQVDEDTIQKPISEETFWWVDALTGQQTPPEKRIESYI